MLGVFLLLMSAVLIPGTFGEASTPPSTLGIEVEVTEDTSYHIYQAEFIGKTFTLAKNDQTNRIEAWSSDAEKVINKVIDKGASYIYIEAGDSPYLLDAPIEIDDLSGLIIESDGATLKLMDGFYDYYGPTGTGVAVAIAGCSDVILKGLVLDGNKDGVSVETQLMYMYGNQNVEIDSVTFANSNHKAFAMGDQGGNDPVLVKDCLFEDNGDTSGFDSDVYISGDHYVTFESCVFQRASLDMTEGQAFNVATTGVVTYTDLTFENIAICFDLRSGEHHIEGATGDNVKVVLTHRGTRDTMPTSEVSDIHFTNVIGLAGSLTAGVFVACGETHIDNAYLEAKGGEAAYHGIYLRYSDVSSCVIENSELVGFYLTGIAVRGTAGDHIIRNNLIENSYKGIESFEHGSAAGPVVVDSNTFVGVVYDHLNTDGHLIVGSQGIWAPTFATSPVESVTVGDTYRYDCDTNESASYALSTDAAFLSIDSDGVVSGVANSVGEYQVTVTATSVAGMDSASQTYVLKVTDGAEWAPRITTQPDTACDAGDAYRYDANANESVTWSMDTDAAFLSINEDSGVVMGTAAAGTYNVVLTATSVAGGLSATQEFDLTVNEEETIVFPPGFTSEPVESATVGVKYTYDCNCNESTTFGLSSNAAFLSIDKSTGVVSGTPTSSGTYDVAITATCVEDGLTATQSYTLNVAAVPSGGDSDYSDLHYTVYMEGSTIKAKNTKTGNIDYSGTDAATVINNAIKAASNGVYLKKGASPYILTKAIDIDGKSNFQFRSDGAILKLTNGFSAKASPMGLYVEFIIRDCSSIQVSGFTIDGNFAGTTAATQLVYIYGNNGLDFGDITVTGGRAKAMVFATYGKDYNVLIHDTKFINNAGKEIVYGDVYAAGEHWIDWERVHFERKYLSDSPGQAFYMQNTGTSHYTDMTFKNMAYAFDFRTGTHIVDGASGDNVWVVLTHRGAVASTPVSYLSNIDFTNVNGLAGSLTSGVYIVRGTTHLDNVHMVAKSGEAANYGIVLRGDTVKSCTVKNTVLENFYLDGIQVRETDGGHTIGSTTIKNSPRGVESFGHTSSDGKITVYSTGMVFQGVSTQYQNTDGHISVTSGTYASTTATAAVPMMGMGAVPLVAALLLMAIGLIALRRRRP